VRFLIDDCLHTSLVAVAMARDHEAQHVNWLGLSGEADWDLMRRVIADDFTFVTNNASDFRKLFAREAIHAGLVIFVPQVRPETQRELFDLVLDELAEAGDLINEALEVRVEGEDVTLARYRLVGDA
jgi:predicted nuclease of predicted toxin-antitoxin system